MVSLADNKYSLERKRGQLEGTIPGWYTTQGYQLFKEKYLHEPTVKEQYDLIARTAAKHIEKFMPEARDKFFQLLWEGKLSPSTPILANMGNNRGLPVSCSGGLVDDSVDGFYTARRETAILTKYGFGTSSYFGDIRPRGSSISIGGTASGVLPVYRGFVRDMQEIKQGSVRRGAFAGYLPIAHQDFDELCDYLHHNPDDLNVGWCISDEDVSKLDLGDSETLRRYQKALKVKMITGKGYFFFTDKVNRYRPISYLNNDLKVKASNLCCEITLHSSEEFTFTCVLSSINVAKWDSIVEDDIFYSTIFLHCVALEFIEKASKIPGLEKAVEFTKNGMALGLGQCGFHTLLQSKMLPFESLEAQYLNTTIAKFIDKHSKKASQHLVSIFGEPLWCKGTGLANTHRLAIAPTKSTALIMGGVSEGINPDPAMVYTQLTAAGEVERIAPEFLKLLRNKGKYSKEIIQSVIDNFGSVQHLDFLNDLEKQVFKTAFEIDQNVILRLASQRQKYIDQAQSINLFFPGDASEEYISQVHKNAFKDENILTLYYCYSKTGVSGSKNECTACQ